MSVYKRRGGWFCDITIDGRRVQRVLKKARTRTQAISALILGGHVVRETCDESVTNENGRVRTLP